MLLPPARCSRIDESMRSFFLVQIVSGSRDKSIKLWNTLGECKYTIQDNDAHSCAPVGKRPHRLETPSRLLPSSGVRP